MIECAIVIDNKNLLLRIHCVSGAILRSDIRMVNKVRFASSFAFRLVRHVKGP